MKNKCTETVTTTRYTGICRILPWLRLEDNKVTVGYRTDALGNNRVLGDMNIEEVKSLRDVLNDILNTCEPESWEGRCKP